MPAATSNNQFIAQLTSDYPQFTFRQGNRFAYRPPKTIAIGPPHPKHTLLTLHELAHAILEHKRDTTHISRLKHESAAWQRAKQLAQHYKIPFDEDFAQNCLDTYRNHLYKKSLCPTCHTIRYEDPEGHFHCPFCP